MTPDELIEQAEQCLLLGDSPSGLRSLEAADHQPLTDLQRMAIATLRIRLHTAAGAFRAAHQVARDAEALLRPLQPVFLVERLHFQVARAELALESGDLLAAEQGVTQAWEEVQRQPVPPPLSLLTSLYLLRGAVALGRGHSAQAGQILLEALQQVRLSALPPLEGAAFAERLGQLCLDAGALTPAQALLEHAVRLRSRELGADHPSVAQAINLLGRVALERGDGQAAEALLSHALKLQSLHLGLEHPATGATLQNLAMAWKLQGQFQRAASMLTKLLRAWQVSPQVHHPTFAFALDNLSVLLVLSGDLEGALEAKTESARRLDGLLEQLLKVGTESQRRAFYERLQGLTDHTVALHLQHLSEREDAARLALTTVLQRKGRLLEAILGTLQRQRLPRSQEEATWLEEWRWTQRELAQLLVGSRETDTIAEMADRRRTLEARLETLERQMSDGHASETLFHGGEGLREALSGRDNGTGDLIGEVVKSLSPDSALLELVRYGVRENASERQTSAAGQAPASNQRASVVYHYGAYLIRADGQLGWWALGEATPIDAAAERLLTGLSTQNVRLSGEAARTLYQQLLQPCEAALSEVTRLYLGADGALNLVPFGVLTDSRDQLLLRRMRVSLVTSGRELLLARRMRSARVSHRAPSPEQPVGEDLYRFARWEKIPGRLSLDALRLELCPPLLLAEPDYDAVPAPLLASEAGQASADGKASEGGQASEGERALAAESAAVSRPTLKPLPGTRAEALAAAQHLPAALVLTGRRASKAALVSLARPVLLHIGTHGDFAPLPEKGSPLESLPMLRARIALAGASCTEPGEDGWLTALEAATLDLYGTRLVVLSGCKTGLGIPHAGDGVYGMRRALVLAGSECQMLSLWSVRDDATAFLMERFYARLAQGEAAAEALHAVQLEMLAIPRFQRPYFWAAFVVSGVAVG